jgi:hypothetical protein
MEIDTGTVLHKLATELGLARDTMEARLRLQKTVYLLQSCGLHLGYGFSWYRYGPYSQELVYDAYRSLHAEKDKYAQQARSLRFSSNTDTWLTRFKKTLGRRLGDAKQLELLASVSFVRKAWHREAKGFVRRFKEHKQCFFDGTPISDHDIEAAWRKLDKLETVLSSHH